MKVLIDRKDEIISAELGRSDQDKQRALARIFVGFSKDLVIWEAIIQKRFFVTQNPLVFVFELINSEQLTHLIKLH